MTDSRIVLATTDPDYERRLRSAYAGALNGDLRTLSDEVLGLPASQIVEAIAGGSSPVEVLALGPGLPVEESLELARRFDLDHPEVSVVLITRPSADLWAKAARSGVRDILDPDADSAELLDVMERASQSAVRRRASFAGDPDAADATPGHIITIVSPKGGSGKTTVATNLAVGLAQVAPGEAVIVDLDLQFGDVAGALQLIPEHTMADAARTPDLLDATALKVLLTPHSSGLYALCAPDSPAEGELITGEAVTAILRRLSENFRYVIIDSSAGLTEATLSALEASTDIMLMCSMDVPSVRSLRKVVVALDQLHMTSQRRHLVLNRADTRVGMSAQDVEATVGLPVDVAVASSRAVPLAINQGIPLVLSDAKHPVSKQLAQLVGRFVEQPARAGRFGKRRSTR
ncbi:MAG TPA: AAA family ATPase [Egibacteraceae bacterium]|jgi:pilus assembly protein CpaE|nr:AAA family ATPase [Egibacteraceae bacterium]